MKMRTKTTIKPEMKILSVLAEHREFEQYKLPKETGFSYRTILRFLKPMEIAGWIRLVRTEASEKGGKEKKIYALTLIGLAIAFKTASQWKPTNRDLNWVIDKMAEKSGHLLPLVLGKWTYFRSAGLGDEFIRAFRWVTQWILEWGHDKEAFATERFWYFIFQMTAGDAKLKWLRALRGDPELRQWAVEEMKEWLAEGRVFTKIHERSLVILEMPNEPDWNKVVNGLRFHAPKESKYSRLSDEDLHIS
jgi:DNA-binding PadR family transcriptional regulator